MVEPITYFRNGGATTSGLMLGAFYALGAVFARRLGMELSAGAVFMMNWQVRYSLDGRYFGLTPTRQIIGRAVPLWTDEGGDGWFQWRATTR